MWEHIGEQFSVTCFDNHIASQKTQEGLSQPRNKFNDRRYPMEKKMTSYLRCKEEKSSQAAASTNESKSSVGADVQNLSVP